MLIQFGCFKADVDVEKTRQFYRHAPIVSETCSCDGCRNFEKAVQFLPAQVKDFFDSLGVDMRKVCECYTLSENTDGTVLYGGFYHICGTLIEGESAWRMEGENTKLWDRKEAFELAPGFCISLQSDIDLPEEGFPQPIIQLEFTADIPWLIEGKREGLQNKQ